MFFIVVSDWGNIWKKNLDFTSDVDKLITQV